MAQKSEEHAANMVSREEYEQLQADLNASQSKVSELEQQVNALTEALRLAQHKRFGASSEKTVDDGSQQLSFLFNEAEVIADHEAAQDKQETLVAAHKRHKKHEYTLDNLPEGVTTEVVEHRVPQEELECPICGETMQEIGKEVVRKLKIIPAQVVVVEHRYYAYACRRCDTEGIETPVTSADREKSVIRGSFATAEAIAHIMVQKFVMGSPLYRQEQELKRQGIPLSRQTMSNWILRAAADYLTPVYNELHVELLRREVLHADETTLQVLHPFSNTLFLFCGRRRDRIKALYWEGNGFVLLYKRLESGSFQWPRKESEARALTSQQYRWLMEGLSIDQPKAHKPVKGLEIV